MDEDLVYGVNTNSASVFVHNETNDPAIDENATAEIQQQNFLEQELNEALFEKFCSFIFVLEWVCKR